MTPQTTPEKKPEHDDGAFASKIPPGIAESIRAYRAALPSLLQNRKLHGQYVLFRGVQQLAISNDGEKLFRLCEKMGVTEEESYLGIIAPTGLEEEEEVEKRFFD
ncbi:MAG: hypothetical protein HY040_04020 [Planctomycetes bacterium]|nr:hypothetical protein [Planctomycetota bacterium]